MKDKRNKCTESSASIKILLRGWDITNKQQLNKCSRQYAQQIEQEEKK